MNSVEYAHTLAQSAKAASLPLAFASDSQIIAALNCAADELEQEAQVILAANAADLAALPPGKIDTPVGRRCRLSEDNIRSLANGLRVMAKAPNPLDQVIANRPLPQERNGEMTYRKRAAPIGPVLLLVEGRADALPQAVGTVLRAHSPVVIKVGRDVLRTAQAQAACMQAGLQKAGLPKAAIQVVALADEDRSVTYALLERADVFALAIPRGSEAMVRDVRQQAAMPVAGHSAGRCVSIISANAAERTAVNVVVDGKAENPGVCNALESVVFCMQDGIVPQEMLRRVAQALRARGVTLVADAIIGSQLRSFGFEFEEANELTPRTEWLDLKIGLFAASSFMGAIEFANDEIEADHTVCVITPSADEWRMAELGLVAAVRIHNASTRFADGGRLGKGGETGISTDILSGGVLGPENLVRWVDIVGGNGHTVGKPHCG